MNDNEALIERYVTWERYATDMGAVAKAALDLRASVRLLCWAVLFVACTPIFMPYIVGWSGIIREFYRHESSVVTYVSGDHPNTRVVVARSDFPGLQGEATHTEHRQALAMAILNLDEQIRAQGGR